MKKVTLAIALAALTLFAGCKKDTTTTMTSTLKASIEQNQGDGSRTALNPTNGAITWNAGDQILVSNGSSTKTFTLTGEAGQTIGTFTCSGEYALGTNNMAVYPATGTFSGNTLSVTLPAEQNGTLGTFANGANPMLAVSETDNLTFTSLCGVLGLSLKGDNIAITAIEVVDNGTGNSSMLSGDFTADCTASQPVLAYAGSNGSNSVRLNIATTLTSEAKEFYIVLPVGTLASANGFTLNLYNGGADPIYSKPRGAALEMQYNTVRKMNELTVTLAPVVTAPEVTTGTATAITADGATCAGTVTSDGNGTISAYGITYSTTEGFDGATGTPVAGGAMDGAGDFTANLTGLTDNTTYYYRAYATNEAGTTYGDIASFTTPVAISLPWVTTSSIVSDVTGSGATCGGTINNDGNDPTNLTYGICYSTTDGFAGQDGTHVAGDNLSSGAFTVPLTGLEGATQYYFRAYATNSVGTVYGDQYTFNTPRPGLLNGMFSVSASTQVYFSQGNLQYTISTGEWSFMQHQYDIVETPSQNVGENYANQNVVSLFGWGTSGYDNGQSCYQPYNTNSTSSNYYSGYSFSGNLDWGYNAITNGGNTENSGWRTLTKDEWTYVRDTRTTASGIRYAEAKVNGVSGFLLLPDNWSSSVYVINRPNETANGYNDNQISADDWNNILEPNGAVFLPVAGYRYGTNVTGNQIRYWTSSYYGKYGNYVWAWKGIGFYDATPATGCSVRLVRDVE